MTRGVLVHEWLAQHGGSENVFDVMVDAFPDADLLCLWSDLVDRYPGRDLQETWLGRTPLRRHKALAMAPMVPTWRRRHGTYDWALVSSHLFAHHVSFAHQAADFRKLVYVHSPARYLWVPGLDTRGNGIASRTAAPPLRWIDRRRAAEPVAVAANSAFVCDRVAAAWDREATVIHPPVDVASVRATLDGAEQLTTAERSVVAALPTEFVLGASRLVPYKRLDLTIRTGQELGMPVVVAGGGPDLPRLQAVAAQVDVPVTFVDTPSTALLHTLYQRSTVYVFPPIEDFGIMPVEALAAGTPVVVGPRGGAREIVDGTTVGRAADSDRPQDLARAARIVMDAPPDACAARAAAFGPDRFVAELSAWMSANGIEVDANRGGDGVPT